MKMWLPLLLFVALLAAAPPSRSAPEEGGANPSAVAERYELGKRHLRGEGVPLDREKGAALIREAAEAGLAAAQGYYGFLLARGLGVEQDESAALEWLRKAAEQGETSAQLNLGLMLVKGLGTERDAAGGLDWIGKAAEAGHLEAQAKLAELHYFGLEGLKKSPERAAPWARRAAEGGAAWAQNLYGSMLEWGRGVELDRLLARDWYRRAAEQGEAKAQANLGRLVATGLAGKRDMVEAYYWLWKAMEQGEVTGTNGIKEILPSMTQEERHAALRRVGIDPERSGPGRGLVPTAEGAK